MRNLGFFKRLVFPATVNHLLTYPLWARYSNTNGNNIVIKSETESTHEMD